MRASRAPGSLRSARPCGEEVRGDQRAFDVQFPGVAHFALEVDGGQSLLLGNVALPEERAGHGGRIKAGVVCCGRVEGRVGIIDVHRRQPGPTVPPLPQKVDGFRACTRWSGAVSGHRPGFCSIPSGCSPAPAPNPRAVMARLPIVPGRVAVLPVAVAVLRAPLDAPVRAVRCSLPLARSRSPHRPAASSPGAGDRGPSRRYRCGLSGCGWGVSPSELARLGVQMGLWQ